MDSKAVAHKLRKTLELGISLKAKLVRIDSADFKENISERQLMILYYIYYLEEFNVSKIAEKMSISKSTVSIVMSKLVSKGYVSKNYAQGNDDKRKIYFKVTESGEKLIEESIYYFFNDFSESLNVFTQQQLKSFDYAMNMLVSTTSEKSKDIHSKIMRSIEKCAKDNERVLKFGLILINFIRMTNDITKDEFKSFDKDITRHQYQLLAAIQNGNKNTVTKLEEFMNSSGSTISITVSRLVDKGYIKKERPSMGEDQRVIYLKLTDEGKKALDEVFSKMNIVFEQYIERHSEENKKIISDAVDIINETFNEIINGRLR